LSFIVSIGDLMKHRLDEKELEANVLLEPSRMRARWLATKPASLALTVARHV
jgi:hypothetical protein